MSLQPVSEDTGTLDLPDLLGTLGTLGTLGVSDVPDVPDVPGTLGTLGSLEHPLPLLPAPNEAMLLRDGISEMPLWSRAPTAHRSSTQLGSHRLHCFIVPLSQVSE